MTMTRRTLCAMVGLWAFMAPVAMAQADDTRDLRVEGKKAVDYVAEQAGQSYAVVIGIDEYRDAKVRRLKYAVADAKSVGQELQRRGYQVTFLLNEQATERGIKTELRNKLRHRVGKDDRVLIYYAGHGQDDQIEGSKTMGYLLPVDGELDNIPGTGISMGLVKELGDALPAKHVLFLMDACYGGVAGQQTRSLPKMTEAYLKQITREKGRQLITAGGADQEALEASDGGHGLFTYYLLRGLTDGLADLNGDGIIPASELYAYLDSRVFTDAQMKGHKQRPELWSMSPEKGEFVFFTTARAGSGTGPGGSAPSVSSGTDSLVVERQQLADERRRFQAEREQLEQARRQGEEQAKLADEKAALEAERKQLELAKAYTAPKQVERERTGKDGASMVLVPGGSFWMGSREQEVVRVIVDCKTQQEADELMCKLLAPLEQPRHQVTLDAVYLDQYEVTNRLFDKFVAATGHQTTAEREGTAWAWIDGKGFQDTSGATWRQPEGGSTVFASNRAQHPVVSVSWHDAEAYCRWAGKRLPTEAEFEYATRGGTQTRYWWGNGTPGQRKVANIADESARNTLGVIMAGYDDGYVKTAPVGSFEANAFGLHDMTGNVAEWTADWYGGSYYATSPDRNPTGPSSGQFRVFRGGSWIHGPFFVRSAFRNGLEPPYRAANVGFRCAQGARP